MRQIKRPEQINAGSLKAEHLVWPFLKCAIGFWGSSGARLSWVLSGILLFILFLNLATSYGMNVWTREIFDALQATDSHRVIFLSSVYPLLLAGSTVVGIMHVYSRMTVQRRWREWLTNQLINRWVKNGRYYQLNLVSGARATPNAAWPTMSGLRPNLRSISSPEW